MKKNKQTSQTNTTTTTAPAEPDAKPASNARRAGVPYVNFKLRDENRQLPVDRVVELLREHAPELFKLAEIVGEWVWITFEQEPAET
jgi:hypothetical protein